MTLASHGLKSGSRHVCLIMALTGQQGPVRYKGVKDVNDAVRTPVGHERDTDTNVNWRNRKGLKRLGNKTGRVWNQRTNREHPFFSIVKIGQDTEKSHGGLKIFAITQTPVKDQHLTQV